MEGRYDYIPADSSAGVTIIDDKFSYSFHATDPACGQLLNAFDAVWCVFQKTHGKCHSVWIRRNEVFPPLPYEDLQAHQFQESSNPIEN